jgi:hypothetical protein
LEAGVVLLYHEKEESIRNSGKVIEKQVFHNPVAFHGVDGFF